MSSSIVGSTLPLSCLGICALDHIPRNLISSDRLGSGGQHQTPWQSSLKPLSHSAIATCRHFLCRGRPSRDHSLGVDAGWTKTTKWIFEGWRVFCTNTTPGGTIQLFQVSRFLRKYGRCLGGHSRCPFKLSVIGKYNSPAAISNVSGLDSTGRFKCRFGESSSPTV